MAVQWCQVGYAPMPYPLCSDQALPDRLARCRDLVRGPVPHRFPACSMLPTGTEAGPRVSSPHPHPDDDALEATRSATPGRAYPARPTRVAPGG